MAHLAAYVHVVSPEGTSCAFGPDDEVSDWAIEQITNPAAWDEAPDAAPPAGTTPRAKRATK